MYSSQLNTSLDSTDKKLKSPQYIGLLSSNTSDLTSNQIRRINNINYVVGSIGFIGSILGVIYSKRTGGGFWRGVGYFILGGAIVSLPAKVIALPFQNKIINESNKK